MSGDRSVGLFSAFFICQISGFMLTFKTNALTLLYNVPLPTLHHHEHYPQVCFSYSAVIKRNFQHTCFCAGPQIAHALDQNRNGIRSPFSGLPKAAITAQRLAMPERQMGLYWWETGCRCIKPRQANRFPRENRSDISPLLSRICALRNRAKSGDQYVVPPDI